MREPIGIKQFAKLAGTSARELERYRSRGLIDPDGDGLLDEMDVLRLRLLMHYASLGHTIEDLEQAIEASSPLVLYADLLWTDPDETVTAEEVATEIDLPVDAVETLFRSIGLGTTVPKSDVQFLHTVKGLIEGGIPLKMMLGVARVYGDTLRRLAQTEVKMIRDFMSEPGRSSLLKDREQSQRLQAVQDLVGPILEPLLLTVHRRHLLRASVQEAVADLEAAERGTDRDTLEATIVFVDLASFTSLARVHGDEVAADILDRFDDLVRKLVEEHNGTMVKQIGDAFMLVFTEPLQAVRFAVDLDVAAGAETNFPAVRTGINAGPVLYRVGDYVGNTVNVAARIAAHANANEILVTGRVADAIEDADLKLVPAGRYELSGIETSVELWRVDRLTEDAPDRDPVCGMAVGEDAVAKLRFKEAMYSFCSPTCLRLFLEDPDRYIGVSREDKPEL
jgi:class 3 adenylate cyclase/YHS domain-containing protein/DNA-binding transcriptional MerR regulator